MMASDGSRTGTGGTSTRPAPNRPRLLDAVPRLDPVRVDIEPPELVRLPRTESWLPMVGRDVADPVLIGSVPTDPVPATAAAGAAATATGVGAAAAGAMPHTSQKPSSMLPVQPGR
jgi:hypothetical protein